MEEHPNHRKYIRILRQMSPEERLLKAFELSESGRQFFIHGLRRRLPNLDNDYLECWARELNVESIWERLKNRAEAI